MRSPVLIIALVLLSCSSFKKLVSFSEVAGSYRDYFGSKLTLNQDSTFNYTKRFHMGSSWTNGTWELKEDSLFLVPKLVYDRLIITNNGLLYDDSKILSFDTIPDTLYEKIQIDPETGYILTPIVSFHNQNLQPPPSILIYRKQCLYQFDKEGNLMAKKVRGLANRKKFPPYYFRTKEE